MSITITSGQVIAWIIVGALAGSITGMIVKREKRGLGHFINLGIGLVGALIGGFLFKVLRIDLGLDRLTIRVEDLIAAIIGSLIFLFVLWLIQQGRKGKP